MQIRIENDLPQVIEMLTQDFSQRGQVLLFYNLKPSIAAIFEGVQPKNFVTYYDENKLDEVLRDVMKQADSICYNIPAS